MTRAAPRSAEPPDVVPASPERPAERTQKNGAEAPFLMPVSSDQRLLSPPEPDGLRDASRASVRPSIALPFCGSRADEDLPDDASFDEASLRMDVTDGSVRLVSLVVLSLFMVIPVAGRCYPMRP